MTNEESIVNEISRYKSLVAEYKSAIERNNLPRALELSNKINEKVPNIYILIRQSPNAGDYIPQIEDITREFTSLTADYLEKAVNLFELIEEINRMVTK